MLDLKNGFNLIENKEIVKFEDIVNKESGNLKKKNFVERFRIKIRVKRERVKREENFL